MKYMIIITGLLSLIAACNTSTPPKDEQSKPTETDSYSKDQPVPVNAP